MRGCRRVLTSIYVHIQRCLATHSPISEYFRLTQRTSSLNHLTMDWTSRHKQIISIKTTINKWKSLKNDLERLCVIVVAKQVTVVKEWSLVVPRAAKRCASDASLRGRRAGGTRVRAAARPGRGRLAARWLWCDGPGLVLPPEEETRHETPGPHPSASHPVCLIYCAAIGP